MKKIDEWTKYKAIAIFLIIVVSVAIVYFFTLVFRVREGRELPVVLVPTDIPPRVQEQNSPTASSDFHEAYMKEFNENTDRVEYTYTLSNGQRVTIRIPRGVNPPPLEAVEQMYEGKKE